MNKSLSAIGGLGIAFLEGCAHVSPPPQAPIIDHTSPRVLLVERRKALRNNDCDFERNGQRDYMTQVTTASPIGQITDHLHSMSTGLRSFPGEKPWWADLTQKRYHQQDDAVADYFLHLVHLDVSYHAHCRRTDAFEIHKRDYHLSLETALDQTAPYFRKENADPEALMAIMQARCYLTMGKTFDAVSKKRDQNKGACVDPHLPEVQRGLDEVEDKCKFLTKGGTTPELVAVLEKAKAQEAIRVEGMEKQKSEDEKNLARAQEIITEMEAAAKANPQLEGPEEFRYPIRRMYQEHVQSLGESIAETTDRQERRMGELQIDIGQTENAINLMLCNPNKISR